MFDMARLKGKHMVKDILDTRGRASGSYEYPQVDLELIKNNIGRPTKYKPEYCGYFLEYLRQGLPVDSFGATIGVCKDTVYEWIKKYPEFSDAYKTGFELGKLAWATMGWQGAAGQIEGFRPDAWKHIGRVQYKLGEGEDMGFRGNTTNVVNVNVNGEVGEEDEAYQDAMRLMGVQEERQKIKDVTPIKVGSHGEDSE